VTDLVHPHALAPIRARIELGHWLAECGPPVSFCRVGWQMEYGTPGFVCPGCGVAREVVWPSPADARRIVELLRYRPDWVNRNWLPHESVMDLLAENVLHHIEHATTPELGAAASTLWLDGNAQLHVLDEPLVIDAAPRLAIGA
jgi:hypothetical protein